jgi:hypothetical protein
MTNVENHTRPRPRLNQDAREKLRVVLCGMFDEIVNQGVPERFTKLVEQMDERRDVPPKGDDPGSETSATSETSPTSETSEHPLSPAVDKRHS